MKKIFNILFFIFLILSLTNCNDDNKEDKEFGTLSIVKSEVTFPATGGNNGYINFNYSGKVEVSSSENWCTTEIAGNRVNVSVTPNTTIAIKCAIVTISSGDQKQEIPIYQMAAVTNFGEMTEAKVTCLEQKYTYSDVISDFPITASSSETWAKVSVDTANNVNINFDLNISKSTRTCNIKLTSASGGSHSVNFIQEGLSIITDSDTIRVYSMDGGNGNNIKITCPVGYTASSNDSWINYSLDNNVLIVSLDASNEVREGKITLSVGITNEITKEITIIQGIIYEDILGQYNVSYTTSSSSTASVYSKIVEIEEKVKGESYTVHGFYSAWQDVADTIWYDFKLTYENGKVYYPGMETIGSYSIVGNSKTYYMYNTIRYKSASNGKNYWTSSHNDKYCVADYDPISRNLLFKDNGKVNGEIIQFILATSDSNPPDGLSYRYIIPISEAFIKK